VAFDDLTDYETNYVFVRHVLSMNTTLPGNALMYRSISSPSSWEAAYALIEGTTALGFAGAAALLLRHCARRPHAEGRVGCCRDGRSRV
jgi:predicted small integral membrane protein